MGSLAGGFRGWYVLPGRTVACPIGQVASGLRLVVPRAAQGRDMLSSEVPEIERRIEEDASCPLKAG
jgi:hypothetical protein